MKQWQLAAAASESTPDQCVPQTRQVARLGSQVLEHLQPFAPHQEAFFSPLVGVPTRNLTRGAKKFHSLHSHKQC